MNLHGPVHLVQAALPHMVQRQYGRIVNIASSVRADLYRRNAQGRFLDASECGPLAVYLASPESRGMTGQSILLDGGMLFV